MPDTDKKGGGDKHPQNLNMDYRAGEKKIYDLRVDKPTTSYDTKQGEQKQRDFTLGTYMRGGTGYYTDTITSVDENVKRRTATLGEVYFEVDKIDLATADASAAKSQANDGRALIAAQAQKIAQTLQQNPGMDIAVVGHASKTGDAKHNQELSDGRADAVMGALIEELNKIDPALAGRVHTAQEGRGDRDLKIQTDKEETRNRSVEILSVSKEADDTDRTYRVVHINHQDMQALATKHDNRFSLNLEGGNLKDKQFSMYTTVSAHGAVVLESIPAKPLEIDVASQNPEDFRFLLRDSKAEITYVQKDYNTISVFADGQPVANVNYLQKKGGIYVGREVQLDEVHVGSVNMKGETKAAMHDSVSQQREQVQQREALFNKIDTNKDHILEPKEVEAYQAVAEQRAKWEGVGRDSISFDINSDRNNKVKETAISQYKPDATQSSVEKGKSFDMLFQDLLQQNKFEQPVSKMEFVNLNANEAQAPKATAQQPTNDKGVGIGG